MPSSPLPPGHGALACYGHACDYWANGCADLEAVYGCDCRGCVCDGDDLAGGGGAETVDGSCAENCFGATCDYWANACTQLETYFGCDCAGCFCDDDEAADDGACFYAFIEARMHRGGMASRMRKAPRATRRRVTGSIAPPVATTNANARVEASAPNACEGDCGPFVLESPTLAHARDGVRVTFW